MWGPLHNRYVFFLITIYSMQGTPLRGMELQEKEAPKD